MASVTAIGKNKIVNVRSADRSFGTPSNFGISLSQYNLNPQYCSWHQIALPNGFFNVNSTSCSLNVTMYNASATAYPIPITIATGNYSASGTTGNVITTVVNALNAAAYAANNLATTTFFTGTQDPVRGFFTLASSVVNWSFTINTAPASLDWILGYRPSQQSALTLTSSATGAAILDLRSYPSIYIRSSLVSGNSVSAHGSDSVLAVVQNSAYFGQTIFQRSPQPDIDLFPVSGQLSQVNFQLVDEWGHELNMDTNQDWEIQIALFFT